MNIGGHGLKDHLRLLAPVFGLIAAVWVLRMVVDFAGAPHMVIHWTSVTVASAVSFLVAVLLIHFKRFGGYANVVFSVFLLMLWENFLIVLAIAFSVLTGLQTIYTAPEFGGSMYPVRHILGHLTFGGGFGTLFGAAMDCLLLWVLRLLVPVAKARESV
jgi:hypothetical protein